MINRRHILLFSLTAGIFAICSSGCGFRPYPTKAASFYEPYKNGNFIEAAAVVSEKAPKATSLDKLLWRLEEGSVRLAAEDYDGSLSAFERAEEILADYESRASVTARGGMREVASAVTNPTAIPYTGRTYDKIMLNTYKCLAYLKQGELSAAKVELRRAYSRQQEAVEEYSKAIAEQQQRARKHDLNYERTRARNPKLRDMTKVYEELDRNNPFAVYVNPMTVYLDGLVHLASRKDNSELQRARKNFERVRDMVRNKELLAPEIEAVEKVYRGEELDATVYIIVENGVGPIRRQVTINFPTPSPDVPFVSTSFPVLRLQPRPYENFRFRTVDQDQPTHILASMDAIIAKEFQHELPIIVTRIIVNGLLRSATQYHARRELGLAGLIGAIVYGAVINRADLRTWLTLPKEFQFTRFPRPADGRVRLLDSHGNEISPLSIPAGQIILVHIKAPGSGAISVQMIKLR